MRAGKERVCKRERERTGKLIIVVRPSMPFHHPGLVGRGRESRLGLVLSYLVLQGAWRHYIPFHSIPFHRKSPIRARAGHCNIDGRKERKGGGDISASRLDVSCAIVFIITINHHQSS